MSTSKKSLQICVRLRSSSSEVVPLQAPDILIQLAKDGCDLSLDLIISSHCPFVTSRSSSSNPPSRKRINIKIPVEKNGAPFVPIVFGVVLNESCTNSIYFLLHKIKKTRFVCTQRIATALWARDALHVGNFLRWSKKNV